LSSDLKSGKLDPNWFDACALNSQYNARLLEEWHTGRTLAKAAARKLYRRIFRPGSKYVPAVAYNGLLVFARPDVNGGGLWFAPDFSRALLHFGIGKCKRIFDFCAGPGYIGFFLLGSGFCESVALSDINPEVIAMARHTIAYNGIEHLADVYTSDVLEQIPAGERWDLVVANSPVVPSYEVKRANIIDYDLTGHLHERFYASVKKFMNPGGFVLTLHTRRDSSVEFFRPMIEAGGGRVIDSIIRKDFRGCESDRYYLLSQW